MLLAIGVVSVLSGGERSRGRVSLSGELLLIELRLLLSSSLLSQRSWGEPLLSVQGVHLTRLSLGLSVDMGNGGLRLVRQSPVLIPAICLRVG